MPNVAIVEETTNCKNGIYYSVFAKQSIALIIVIYHPLTKPMKASLTLLLAISICAAANAQSTSKTSQANIELALARTGVLLKRQTKKAGTFQDIDFYRLEIEDVATKTKYSGVRIEYVQYERATIFIDSDELKTLVKSLELFRDKRFEPTPNIDYKFLCKGGLDMEFGWSGNQWGVFIKLEQGTRKKELFVFEVVDILRLLNILIEASSSQN